MTKNCATSRNCKKINFLKCPTLHFSTRIFTGIVEKIGADFVPLMVDIPSRFKYSADKFIPNALVGVYYHLNSTHLKSKVFQAKKKGFA